MSVNLTAFETEDAACSASSVFLPASKIVTISGMIRWENGYE